MANTLKAVDLNNRQATEWEYTAFSNIHLSHWLGFSYKSTPDHKYYSPTDLLSIEPRIHLI